MDFLQKIFDNLDIKYDMNDSNKGLINKYDITITVDGKDCGKENCTCTCNCDTKCFHNECNCDEPHYEDIDADRFDPVTKIEMEGLDPIIAENAVTADSLRLDEDDELFDCLDEDEEDAELIVLEYIEEGDECYFQNIEDEAEFDRVCEYVQTLEYDEDEE